MFPSDWIIILWISNGTFNVTANIPEAICTKNQFYQSSNEVTIKSSLRISFRKWKKEFYRNWARNIEPNSVETVNVTCSSNRAPSEFLSLLFCILIIFILWMWILVSGREKKITSQKSFSTANEFCCWIHVMKNNISKGTESEHEVCNIVNEIQFENIYTDEQWVRRRSPLSAACPYLW